MRIAEIFRSRQGEGKWTGTDSVFIRASGCNLRCWYCDTPYASWAPEGEDLALDDIFEQTLALGGEHVVVTGGEPMLFSELIPLTQRLVAAGKILTIETAGTLYLPVSCQLMSISPKLSNSTPGPEAGSWRQRHDHARHSPEVLSRLVREYPHQLKFVVDRAEDLREIDEYLTHLPAIEPENLWLMPQGTEPQRLRQIEQWLAAECVRRGWQFCPRRQVEWYGLTRGT